MEKVAADTTVDNKREEESSDGTFLRFGDSFLFISICRIFLPAVRLYTSLFIHYNKTEIFPFGGKRCAEDFDCGG